MSPWLTRSKRLSWVFGQLALSTPAPANDPDRWELLTLCAETYDSYYGRLADKPRNDRACVPEVRDVVRRD